MLGLGRKIRVKIDGDPTKFMRKARADVAVLSTSSSLKAMKPQMARPDPARDERGLHLRGAGVSHARATRRSSASWTGWPGARRSPCSTGVNPGYAMDALALMLTAPCATVRACR